MEARLTRVIVLLAVSTATTYGGGHYSRNFVVTAPSAEIAREVCQAAEHYRRTLAIAWLGHELPPWHDRCPITVNVSPNLGAGGMTSFSFQHGRPFDWRMSIQGPKDRILDSVLPHEVTHTIFATHFGRPLPRWADEGACTTVEHESEKGKHYQHLYRYLTTHRGIPFNQMFRMTEYPSDIMPLYAQGHSVVEYLVAQGGHRRFIDFLADGMSHQDWDRSIQSWYGYSDLSDLQIRWVDWLRTGRPALDQGLQVAANPPSNPLPTPPNAESLPPVATPIVSSDRDRLESDGLPMAATAAKPAPTTVASGGWYSRQHDHAQHLRTASAELPVTFTPGSTASVGSQVISSATVPASAPGYHAVSAVDWETEGQWTSQSYRR